MSAARALGRRPGTHHVCRSLNQSSDVRFSGAGSARREVRDPSCHAIGKVVVAGEVARMLTTNRDGPDALPACPSQGFVLGRADRRPAQSLLKA